MKPVKSSSESFKLRKFLPLGLNIRKRKCLVVGGGKIGARKVFTLVSAGADVTLIAPDAVDSLKNEASSRRITWKREEFAEKHLTDAFIVVAATDNVEVNESICKAAKKMGAFVCNATSAEGSQIIFGALHDTDNCTIAVFTDGRDPALSKKTRGRIAELLELDNRGKGK